MTDYHAWMISQANDDSISADLTPITVDDLPGGDVLVQVAYSCMNWKDGAAITNSAKIVRQFPMVPGVDFAGTVLESSHGDYAPGDRVMLNGWGVGEKHWGGLSQIARVKGDWLTPIPDGLTFQRAMALGTAGLTSMLAVMALEESGLTPDRGEVLVTGASGGTGSIAVAILAGWGYTVVASTGREELTDHLKALGASEVIGRLDAPSRPLGKSRWAGAVDVVGGGPLANVISTLQYGAAVAAFGLTAGAELNTSVYPFILRGVRLIGIDSVMCPPERRLIAWKKLRLDLSDEVIDRLHRVVPMADVPDVAADLMRGAVRGRVVVDVNAGRPL